MTKQQIYSNSQNIDKWPRWLEDEEIKAVIGAAKAGENPGRDGAILAAMLYLGLEPDKAVKIQYCRAFGDAIEDQKRRAFLHIPSEYKDFVIAASGEDERIRLSDRITDCTKEEAEKAVKQAFARAGVDADYCFMRLTRTAARLHYLKQWTNEENIIRWFPEIGFIKDQWKERFYKTLTDAEMLEKVGDLLTGRRGKDEAQEQ